MTVFPSVINCMKTGPNFDTSVKYD